MSIILFKKVKQIDLREYGIKNSTQCKYLLEVLADIAQEKKGNLCIPQLTTIAKRMNAHPKTVHRWAKELAKARIIFINHRIGTSNSYVFNPDIFGNDEAMNITRINHTPTIEANTQNITQSKVATYSEQSRPTPSSNDAPLTLKNLNNTYFRTLKKENPNKYRDEVIVTGREMGFTEVELSKMPFGELEIYINKNYNDTASPSNSAKDRSEALAALRNFKFKKV